MNRRSQQEFRHGLVLEAREHSGPRVEVIPEPPVVHAQAYVNNRVIRSTSVPPPRITLASVVAKALSTRQPAACTS